MQPIVYIDTSAIRNGKLEKLKVAMSHLAAFVETNVLSSSRTVSSSMRTKDR